MFGGSPLRLIGGGLFNCLLALRLQERGIPFELLEQKSHLAGDHTWSFFESDIGAMDLEWVSALGGFRWDGYSVRFPEGDRHLETPYRSLRSEHLRDVLNQKLPAAAVKLGARSSSTDGVLADGSFPASCETGWQKFVGWDVHFSSPHGLKKPVVMDASVEQIDGFRFTYLLPFNEKTLLIEDTRYSNTAHIDRTSFDLAIQSEIHRRWPRLIFEVGRTEQAALPIPLASFSQPGRFGVAGGFFHPTTGYSFPFAVRVSRVLADLIENGHSSKDAWTRLHREEAKNFGFYLNLNRMLFLAADPKERWKIFARFYRLNQHLIERFYGGRSTALDKIRLLAGRPPVPMGAALRSLAWT